MGRVYVSPNFDLVTLALDAGASPDAERYYCDGWYTVANVTGEALSAALGRYDHLANRKAATIAGLRARAQKAIRAALDDLDLLDLVIGDMALAKKNAIIAKVRAAKTWLTNKEAEINAVTTLEELNAVDLTPR